MIHFAQQHLPWLVTAYVIGAGALAAAIGDRLRKVRTAHEQIAAMHRRRLGL